MLRRYVNGKNLFKQNAEVRVGRLGKLGSDNWTTRGTYVLSVRFSFRVF